MGAIELTSSCLYLDLPPPSLIPTFSFPDLQDAACIQERNIQPSDLGFEVHLNIDADSLSWQQIILAQSYTS